VIRLAIIEDHPAIAEGLTALMRGEADVTVVGTAGDAISANRLIEAQLPDVVLVTSASRIRQTGWIFSPVTRRARRSSC